MKHILYTFILILIFYSHLILNVQAEGGTAEKKDDDPFGNIDFGNFDFDAMMANDPFADDPKYKSDFDKKDDKADDKKEDKADDKKNDKANDKKDNKADDKKDDKKDDKSDNKKEDNKNDASSKVNKLLGDMMKFLPPETKEDHDESIKSVKESSEYAALFK